MNIHIQQLQEKLDRHMAYLEQDKNNPNLLLITGLLKAQLLHHQQQLTDAIALLEQLLLNHESNAEIAGLLSLMHFDNHDAIKAEACSQKALTLNPANYEARLVQLLLSALQHNASLDKINDLIKTNPHDSRLWFVLGTTHLHHMNFPDAEHAFVQTTTLFPDFYDSWICMGWCHLLQNNLEKAEMVYQQAMKIDAESADAWGGLALVHALRGNISEANHCLLQANALDSECFLAAVAHIMLANQSTPKAAATQFHATFPHIAPAIDLILAQSI